MYIDSHAPWDFPRWKSLTGIQNGLFPEDDSLLPKTWSREDANSVRSYFDQYSKKKKEDDKIKFASARAGGHQVPGRDFWRKWVTDSWKDWKIHSKIIEVLSIENLHPLTLALNSKTRSLESWPPANQYVPMAVDPVGAALFGPECQDIFGRVQADLRQTTQALIQRTWTNLYNQVQRTKVRLAGLEEDATNAFNGRFLLFYQINS
jgi:TATA-binding protein-associated factor